MPRITIAQRPAPRISNHPDFERINKKWNGIKTLLFTFEYSILWLVPLQEGAFELPGCFVFSIPGAI